jgi:hypothetical protein
MKDIFESAIAADIFRGKALLKEIGPVFAERPDLHAAYLTLQAAWPEKKLGEKTFLGILRWSFFIELVKTPKIETTKFEVRWAQRLGEDDPRFASYDNCLNMCVVLAKGAAQAVTDPERRTLLEAFDGRKLVPYEQPIDYRRREKTGRLHVDTNVEWLWGDVPRKTVLLRDYLLSSEVGEHQRTFKLAYKKKIKVKTYLTDRVLTGAHKTNREKR